MTGDEITYGVLHLFSGSAGGAMGFGSARQEWNGLRGRFVTLGGVDVDEEACQDFEALTGVRATRLDLFSREDYTAFHGKVPPADWREATPEDIRAASGNVRPDVVFTSPPCKGISALLPKAQADSPKYQALNRLTVRGIVLMLEAWKDDPPGLVILENVPRIMSSRGAHLLAQIKLALKTYGYRVQDGTHDMGEVGGLSQHRRRYLLVARHPSRIPQFLYQPPQRKVLSIGHALGPLPMPDDPTGGPMHRLPRLNWLTWLRLALIPAGGDWRNLCDIGPGSYRIEPEAAKFNHIYRVTGFGEPLGAVTSSRDQAVADPRIAGEPFGHAMKVAAWDEPAGTITAARSPSYGAIAAADPRLSHEPRKGVFRVGRWEEPSGTVVGSARAAGSNGMASVADPRVPERPDRRSGQLTVLPWDDAANTVTGEDSVGSGAQSVADPRLTCTPHNGAMRVVAWDDAAPTVTASGDIHAQGAAAVADPRIPQDSESGVWVIISEDNTWHRPLTTYELAMLQGFPTHMRDGKPLTLAGKSQGRWRERIGNAVPVPAARAVAEMMLLTLIAVSDRQWLFSAYGTAIWVREQTMRRRVLAWNAAKRREAVQQ